MERIEIIGEIPLDKERMLAIISNATKEHDTERKKNMDFYRGVIKKLVEKGYTDNLEAQIWLGALNNPRYRSVN